MNYLNEKTPPVREDRLKACDAYGGSCCGLVEKSKKGCLNGTKRSFAQTQGCQLNLSLVILQTIRDAVIIVHGPIGCGGSSVASAGVSKNFQKLRDPSARGLIWISTNLDDVDVISGGEDKLRNAIKYAEQEFRPSAIIIVNSCVPALIGDDLDGVVAQLQNEINAKLVPVHCEGFKTKIMASAYDAVYHGILRHLVNTPEYYERVVPNNLEELKEKFRISRTVNLLNVSSMSRADEAELIRLIKGLELNVNVMPCYAHPDDFENATQAAVNVSICPTHDDYFAEHLKEKYGIPFILRTIPIGIKYTNEWLRDIAKFFGQEEVTERIIQEETRELEAALAPYREVLKGKRVILSGGEIRAVATAELLQSLGMEVVALRAHHYDRFADELFEELSGKDTIPINVATCQPFEQSNLLEKLKPDIYIGHIGANSWAAKHGVPILPIFGQMHNYMGYIGVFEVARRLVRLLKNPSFNRNLAANTRQPYFEKWFEEDPFAYIENNISLDSNVI